MKSYIYPEISKHLHLKFDEREARPVSLSVNPPTFLHDGWLDFFHIGFYHQVIQATDASKTEFGSVPNLSNFGHFIDTLCYILSVCCDISEKNVAIFVHIWYSYQVQYIPHACKIEFDSVSNLSNYGHCFTLLCICCDVSETNDLMLFIFSIIIKYHVLLMLVK